MLREVRDAGWEARGVWPWRRHFFVAGNLRAGRGLRGGALASIAAAQRSAAVAVLDDGDRRFWWCLDRYYSEREGLAAEDVYALAYERLLRARRRIERARAAVAGDRLPAARRQGVPLELRRLVWERDRGRCVECGSAFELQFDHVIPVALGGATSAENLQVLCGTCNRRKGDSLG